MFSKIFPHVGEGFREEEKPSKKAFRDLTSKIERSSGATRSRRFRGGRNHTKSKKKSWDKDRD